MQFNYINASSGLVEAVDILGDKSEPAAAPTHYPLQLSKGVMRGIWLCNDALLAAPVVPLGDRFRVSFKCFGRANWLGSYFDQRPSIASRKVGMPLSADTPAPVSTTIERALRSASVKSDGRSEVTLKRKLPAANDVKHIHKLHLPHAATNRLSTYIALA